MADLETDYLIIGAGAVGLAFADTLIDEDPDCHITFVDKHSKPGGHWNDAYGFVALHQPSATYGVNSMTFPSEHIDTHGPNKGLHALASGTEVLAYFEKVMNMRLIPTGRVDYHRLSEFTGRDEDGTARFKSILSGKETTVKIRRRLVDATFYQTSVPSTHTRPFEEHGDVDVVPPGDLPQLWKRPDELPEHYVILGAGKTAMDTGVWLVQAGVDPDYITWVRPRESWLWNRDHVQPGEDFIEATMEMQVALMETASKAEDGAELMRMMGEKDYYLRIDESIEPEMFHFAIISRGEIEILRRIKHVVRDGHVKSVAPGKMVMQSSEVSLPENTLFIDCTASAVPFEARGKGGPIFREDTIVLQPLMVPLVVFSAAITAWLEANYDDDNKRNAMAAPGPLTDTPMTFPFAHFISMMNRGAWSQDEKLSAWLASSRLDLTGPTLTKMAAEGSPKLAQFAGVRQTMQDNMPGLIKLGMAGKAVHESTLN